MGAERFFNIKCRVSGLKPDAAVVVATVRALKCALRQVQGGGRPPAARGDAQGEPGRRADRRGQPAQAAGEHPRARRRAGRRDQRDAQRLPLRARRHPGARRVDGRQVGGLHALRRRRPGRGRARRGGRRGRGASRTRSTTSTRPRRRCGRRSRPSRPRSTAPTAWTTPRWQSKQLDGYEKNGFGNLPVCIAKTQYSLSADAEPQGRADRVPAAGPRGPRLGRRRLRLPDLRRHAHHAGPGEQARRDQHRPRRDGEIVGLY